MNQNQFVYFHPLNFIRFILALGVILFHYGTAYYPFDHGFLNTLIVNSSFRVSFFFFISGFVMCMVYARQEDRFTPMYFYKRRFSRIFPVYWLAFVFTVLAVVLIKDAAPKGLNLILHGLGLQSLNPGHVLDLNYPTWSISVELIFYLIFPFLIKWILRCQIKKLLVISLIVWMLQSLQHILFVEFLYNGTKISEEFISTFPLWHLATFFVGMVVARIIALKTFVDFFTAFAVWGLVLSFAVFIYLVYLPNPILKYVHNGLLSPIFALLIISLYYESTIVNKTLSHPSLSKLGDISYGLFIFQYPVWVVCSKLAKAEFLLSTWFLLIYLIVLFVFAWLVNFYFEKPLLRKIRQGAISGV